MKATVIGGGSLLWAFGFSRQFILSEKLKNINLTLMDIDPDALDLIGTVAKRFNKAQGNRIKLTTTTNLESALKGADFVITSISTGRLPAMRHDLEIPEKYGILHTVGDTVGPGGWMRAVRNIPVFQGFGEKISKICPDAWLINVSNPLTPLTRVAQRNFGIKTIGMCPGVEGVVSCLVRMAGKGDATRIDFTVTGIDHGSWFTRVYADGVDVLARIKEMGYYRSDDRLPGEVRADDPLAEVAHMRADFALWREVNYMPAIGDRHMIENWPNFLAVSPGTPESTLPFAIKRTHIDERQAWYDQARVPLQEYAQTGDEAKLGAQGHGDDPIVTVIEALSGQRTFVFTSNYTNIGQIPQLPLGAVVETRCQFDAAGVHPHCSPMPPIITTLVAPHVLRQEAIIDIALTGTFDELVALVISDPMCCRLKIGECRQMVREMLEANRALIQNSKLLEF
jgi:alpha-galactosidase/6-phospho-beta-glucosidase family protein